VYPPSGLRFTLLRAACLVRFLRLLHIDRCRVAFGEHRLERTCLAFRSLWRLERRHHDERKTAYQLRIFEALALCEVIDKTVCIGARENAR
jgi:hypothetical protein